MTDPDLDPAAVVELIDARTSALVTACSSLDRGDLERPTLLPEWTVLTVLCHLRYGAQVLHQITEATLGGQPSAFYPGGREVQRPFTLRPALGEPHAHVLDSLAVEARDLSSAWTALPADVWHRSMISSDVSDPIGAPTLYELALSRLVEVMAHGSDLGLGLAPWPLRFGQWLLPLRVGRARVDGGFSAVVEFHPVDGAVIVVGFVDGHADRLHDASAEPDVVVSGTANDLVALLLGRNPLGGVSMTGEAVSVSAFRHGIVGP